MAQNTRKPGLMERALPVVTMDVLPGREIAEVVGDVVGVMARNRELPPELRSGNVQDGYATMLTDSRQAAVTKMVGDGSGGRRRRRAGTALRLQRDHPVDERGRGVRDSGEARAHR